MPDNRDAVRLRLAHALAWKDFMPDDADPSPKRLYESLEHFEQDSLERDALDLLDAIERAGLEVRVRGSEGK